MKRTLLTILSVIVLSVSSAKAQYDPYAFAMWQMQQNNMMYQQNARMIHRYNQVVNQPVYFPPTQVSAPFVFTPTVASTPVQTFTNDYNTHTTTNNSQSSTSSNKSSGQTCYLCHGIKKCWTCNGTRKMLGMSGKYTTCPNCTDGWCSHCHGTGLK